MNDKRHYEQETELDLLLRELNMRERLIKEQTDLIALLKAQLQAKEEGDVCI